MESVKIFEKLFASSKKDMVKVTFKLKVSDFIDTSMVQLYPIELAKQLVDYFAKDKKKGVISRRKTAPFCVCIDGFKIF